MRQVGSFQDLPMGTISLIRQEAT
uniref:Uncharacterized protein n=1 Tax=Anguilla anguilla TaxID=7936 RepID=A0A0E9RLU4_ANGAN